MRFMRPVALGPESFRQARFCSNQMNLGLSHVSACTCNRDRVAGRLRKKRVTSTPQVLHGWLCLQREWPILARVLYYFKQCFKAGRMYSKHVKNGTNCIVAQSESEWRARLALAERDGTLKGNKIWALKGNWP